MECLLRPFLEQPLEWPPLICWFGSWDPAYAWHAYSGMPRAGSSPVPPAVGHGQVSGSLQGSCKAYRRPQTSVALAAAESTLHWRHHWGVWDRRFSILIRIGPWASVLCHSQVALTQLLTLEWKAQIWLPVPKASCPPSCLLSSRNQISDQELSNASVIMRHPGPSKQHHLSHREPAFYNGKENLGKQPPLSDAS